MTTPQKPSLMIIDPDTERRAKYAKQLEGQFSIEGFSFGDEAADFIRELAPYQRPAVVIANSFVGSKVTTVGVIRNIKEISPNTHILVLTEQPLRRNHRQKDRFAEAFMAAGADRVTAQIDLVSHDNMRDQFNDLANVVAHTMQQPHRMPTPVTPLERVTQERSSGPLETEPRGH